MESNVETTTENIVDVNEELKRCKEENNALNRRLLGVNELARLLQEKTEFSNSLQEKNKRLEIAVVRLENRCSNIEKKAKTGQQFSSLPSNPKSMPNSPFIPGPSRQILESLMKDNHELKKTINNLTKGGPTGYKEAVKMNHLEEVIDQKKEKIELLQKQIENLTAPHDTEGSNVAVNPGLLKRQLLKMEQAMKVKDRFCTLLSDRVSELERELKEDTDGYDETEGASKGDIDVPNDPSHLIKDLEVKEKNFHKVIDELQSQVEKERNEKKDLLSKAEESGRKVNGFESEIVSLNLKVESLNTYNSALVRDKMDLSSDVMRLNDRLQQTQDDGKIKKQEDEFNRKMTKMQEKIDELEDDNSTLTNKLFEINSKYSELYSRMGGGIHAGPLIRPSGGSTRTFPPAYDPISTRGQLVAVDGHNRIRSSPEPQHCGSNMLPYIHRQELAARDVGSTEGLSPPDTTLPQTATTPTITPSNPQLRNLDLNSMPPYQRFPSRTPQTPGYHQYPPTQQQPNQPLFNSDGSPWTSYMPARSQIMSLPVTQTNMSMSHSNVPYHPQQHPQQQQYSNGALFGGQQQFGNNAGNVTPGSGYMTHSTQGRYYGSSPQPPLLQRRQSPPGQHNNNSNQHYHTGQ